MSNQVIAVKKEWAQNTRTTRQTYERLYADSISDPESFWATQAEEFWWSKKWDVVKNTTFGDGKGGVDIRWFDGGKTNICYNCLDRHLPERANQTAIIFEGDEPTDDAHITYGELHRHVCQFANVLKGEGVKKGDRVTLYMPMIVEAAVAMLACARIGAVHSVVFGGFSPEALRGRIEDCASDFIITADEGVRGGKKIPLKANVDTAIEPLSHVKKVIVVKRTGAAISMGARDVWYHERMATASPECVAEPMHAEDPFFILYTSGSTGKPKGVLHTTGGYMVWAGLTFTTTFDYRAPVILSTAKDLPHVAGDSSASPQNDKGGDIFWCSADVGWVTGHSYVVYGPLLCGAQTLMFEGVPTYPDSARFWNVIDKHAVTIFYTAPTAIRALMREGDALVQQTSRKTLRILGTVGEPINPEAWQWYWRVVGDGRCPIVDTWWQTETGGHMLTPLPGATPLKPGAACWPFYGVQPVILDPTTGKELHGACEGVLAIKESWPGQARSVYGDHARFEQTYFSQYAGYYFTGDGARRDADGDYWITGRVDDVLNVSGHRIGTAEVESALVGHDHVTEAAVVGFPHDIKGQGIYCYVTLALGVEPSDAIHADLKQWVRKEIGPIATPDVIQFTPALPKTRSGKIMRRILRKIAEGDTSNLGDISTLLNPEIVEQLIKGKLSS